MIYRKGDIISDGITGKIVAPSFTAWHSEMTMDEIQGAPCAPIVIIKHTDVNVDITNPVSYYKTKPYKQYRRPKIWLR